MFCLDREDLNTVLNQFPTLRASLEARARERLQELYLSENRPLETILALFSDPVMDDTSLASETESELSPLVLSSRDNSTYYQDHEHESEVMLAVDDHDKLKGLSLDDTITTSPMPISIASPV